MEKTKIIMVCIVSVLFLSLGIYNAQAGRTGKWGRLYKNLSTILPVGSWTMKNLIVTNNLTAYNFTWINKTSIEEGEFGSIATDSIVITGSTNEYTIEFDEPSYFNIRQTTGSTANLQLYPHPNVDIVAHLGIGKNFRPYTDTYGNLGTNNRRWGNLWLAYRLYLASSVYIDSENDNSLILHATENIILDQNTTINGNLTANQIYGEMWYQNNTGTTINFAIASTWYSLFYTSGDISNGFNYVGGFSQSSNLTTQIAGRYRVNYIASGSGQNNHVYYTTVMINGLNQTKCTSYKKMSAGGDVMTMPGTCIISLNVGDNVSVATMDYGGTGNGIYYGSNLNLVRIGD